MRDFWKKKYFRRIVGLQYEEVKKLIEMFDNSDLSNFNDSGDNCTIPTDSIINSLWVVADKFRPSDNIIDNYLINCDEDEW